MDNSGLGGGFSSGINVGMLDLELPVHRHEQTQLGRHHMNMMIGLEDDSQPIGVMEMKGSSMKGKATSPLPTVDYSNGSEDDFAEDGNDENVYGAKGKSGSRWQRMKWTDEVVRLLIAVVACVGDDGLVEGAEGNKRKAGILQKKGKWKTVSKIMISKGCNVSPQQCEDKFNDLNKRYKRLNDTLGRGTSCKVVENPSLMDSMPHLSSKAKDDVRKILSSKHLFYKEMCAYHNGQTIPNSHDDFDLHHHSLPPGKCSNDNNESEEEEGEEHNDHNDHDDDDDNNEVDHSADDGHFWPAHDVFEAEMARVLQNPANSPQQQREWLNKQTLRLQEERLAFQAQALDLEKQRFKWLRYCSKKNRELKRSKLENERSRLENERRVLELRRMELEVDLSMSGTSLKNSMSLGVDLLQARDQIDPGRS